MLHVIPHASLGLLQMVEHTLSGPMHDHAAQAMVRLDPASRWVPIAMLPGAMAEHRRGGWEGLKAIRAWDIHDFS